MAKLASKYIGPYEIMEKKGLNTYSLMDQDGDVEDLIDAEHLKRYVDGKESEEECNETEPEGTNVALNHRWNLILWRPDRSAASGR